MSKTEYYKFYEKIFDFDEYNVKIEESLDIPEKTITVKGYDYTIPDFEKYAEGAKEEIELAIFDVIDEVGYNILDDFGEDFANTFIGSKKPTVIGYKYDDYEHLQKHIRLLESLKVKISKNGDFLFGSILLFRGQLYCTVNGEKRVAICIDDDDKAALRDYCRKGEKGFFVLDDALVWIARKAYNKIKREIAKSRVE